MSKQVYDKLLECGAPPLEKGWHYNIKESTTPGEVLVSISTVFVTHASEAVPIGTYDGVNWHTLAGACGRLHRKVVVANKIRALVGRHP